MSEYGMDGYDYLKIKDRWELLFNNQITEDDYM